VNCKKYQIQKLQEIQIKKSKIDVKETKSKKDKSNLWWFNNKINNLTQLIANKLKISAVWGSKALLLNPNKDLDEWNEKRDYRIYLIGSKDETFGNSLCQLQNLDKLVLTLPKNLGKKLNLQVNFNYDKSNYKLFQQAIADGKALTYKIFKRNGSWFVQASFGLRNECTYQPSSIGVDVNYNLITTCSVKEDGNPEQFMNYKFDLEETNKYQNNQILSDVANAIVQDAKDNNKNIVVEDLQLATIKRNKRKVSLVAYNKFLTLLKCKAVKENVVVEEINPAYTSLISKVKYKDRLGRTIHACAAYVIGRRGMKFNENLPNQIACCLQSEKDKFSWKNWAKIYKLKNVSNYLMSHRDQTNLNLSRKLDLSNLCQ
jgi:IS605 OrfB family transposase